MSKWKWTAIIALALSVVAGACAASFVAGYARADSNFELRSFAQRVLVRLQGVLPLPRDMARTSREAAPAGAVPESRDTRYTSVFLPLVGQVSPLPGNPGRAGGGLTSLGHEVLLLTAEGTLFASNPEHGLIEVSVSVPDNGHDAYVLASESPDHAHRMFDLVHPRYNDVLHYESEVGRGLLISYTEYFGDAACYGTTIAALELSSSISTAADLEADADDWEVLFRTEPCLPLQEDYYALEGDLAGGRMVFEAPSTVYLSSGDYRWDGIVAPTAAAQRADWDYGKVIELDLLTREARTISQGHRNPQGITLDREGQLWVVEHGPRGGDELNLIRDGKDYGWPSETLGTMYSGLRVPNTLSHGRHNVFEAPAFAWLPSVAPSSIELIDGFHSVWDGDLLLGTLRDQHLHRLRIRDGRVLFAEPIDIGKRIRDVLQHSDGRLVLWTDSRELVFLTVGEHGRELRYLEEGVLAGYDESLGTTARQALDGCMQCHALVADVHAGGPSLAALYNAPIAATSFPHYSEALKAVDGRWTREALMAFLRDPQGFVPGTTMPPTGYEDPALLEALVDLMEALSEPSDPRH